MKKLFLTLFTTSTVLFFTSCEQKQVQPRSSSNTEFIEAIGEPQEIEEANDLTPIQENKPTKTKTSSTLNESKFDI